MTRDLALRLLEYEAENSEPKEPGAFRVYEKLRSPLCELAGVAGFRSLVFRALTLAKAEAPGLSTVQVTDDGYLRGRGEIDPQIAQHLASEEKAVLIAELLELLYTFIGEALLMQLVRDVWPKAVFDDGSSVSGRRV